jgi:hypothetical protein
VSAVRNPWVRPAPAGWGIQHVQICDATSRIEKIRTMGIADLERVIDWPGNQVTVRKAAENRLRRIRRRLTEGWSMEEAVK